MFKMFSWQFLLAGKFQNSIMKRTKRITLIRQVRHRLKYTAFVRFIGSLFFNGLTIKRTEPVVWQFLYRNVKPGWKCADIGANRGEFTLLMAKRVMSSGLVYAFELYPKNVLLLQSNLWRYRHRVKVENFAVTDGSTQFVDVFAGRNCSDAEWHIMGYYATDKQMNAEFRVRATSLDDYFASGTAIDLVKIDVEGAAPAVLAGMARILRQARPIIIIEFHNDSEWAGKKHLEEVDYALYNLKGEKLQAAEDQVFHCVALPKECQPSAYFAERF